MFTSAELIEALQRRTRRSLRPSPPVGEFPPGWSAWLAAMAQRRGAITGAARDAIVAVFLQRELARPPRRDAELTRWQAFTTLWRQQWQPAEPETRRERIAAYAITLGVHVVLVAILVWLSWAHFSGMPAPARGQDVVQVQFIGEGTPEAQGGGAPGGEQPQPDPGRAAPAAAPAPQAPATPVEPREVAATPPPPAPAQPPRPQPPVPTPEPPEPVAPAPEQPLQVTQVPAPDTAFVLVPPTPPQVDVRQAEVRVPAMREQPEALQRPEPPVELVQAPQLPRRPLPTAQVAVPDLRIPVERLPDQPRLAPAPARTVATPQAQVRVPELRDQAAALPGRTPRASAATTARPSADVAAAGAPSTAAAPSAGTAQSPRPAGGQSPEPAGRGDIPRQAGAGPETQEAPGSWSAPVRGDDWGLSDRNRPGGQAGSPGLFDGQGRPRLAPGDRHEPGGGLPPGMSTDDLAHLDRNGTWLKRPPIGYEPTRFDRYWRPNETLLEEWVRKSIKDLVIPIPGTSKSIHCVVSILALGGACGVSDPNLNDQEVEARPPPDIPFKPELQDDPDVLEQPATP